ncbi:Uncharacterised protein [Escherichia coli]|uniref:AbiJ N-terminal domain-containing protein n=1 Tax=Escherichia coli TaxID=562 RepID=A0A377BEA5_ECOLX|nr:Uncharacterised protein [Escherichia coli]
MLNKVSQINLAKILAEKFNEGDWQELFAVTDCEDVPEGLNQFYRHVHWDNPELKGVAIAAIESTLARDADNLSKIWALDNVQRFISIAILSYSMNKEHCESERAKKCFGSTSEKCK